MARQFIEYRTPASNGSPAARREGIRLEINRDKLLELLRDRHLCADDFNCLDCDAKACVWRLMLACCRRSG